MEKKASSNTKKIVIMILITAALLLIFRLGAFITMPFVDYDVIHNSATSAIDFGFLDVFSGGALSNFSILCLGVSPYITSSIVIQLLEMDIVPKLKEWSEEGPEGRQKLNQLTRYVALGLAFVQSLALAIGIKINYNEVYFVANDFASSQSPFLFVYLAIVATAGTAFTLWLAELITAHGVGNGTSILIVAGILATFPQMFTDLISQLITTEETRNILVFIVVILLLIAIIVFIVFMEGAERKIPIQYANRPAAAAFRGKGDSNIPIKLNSASVIPVIFASTLMSLPTTAISLLKLNTDSGAGYWLNQIFSTTSNHNGNVTINIIGFVVYILLIFIFSFFYSFLQMDPTKMADNLQKQNAYVPAVRPGEETAGYISRVLFKITMVGATYLSIVAILPIVMSALFDLPSSAQIGGTGLIIVVGVAIETWKQLKQTKQEKQYRGFMD